MSFTTNIKNEIAKNDDECKENISELSGFVRNNGIFNESKIELLTENATVAKKIYSLVREIFDVSSKIDTRKNNNFSKNHLYIIEITDNVEHILRELSVIDESNIYLELPNNNLINTEEEVRAYLRGAFLSKGSINDPKTSRYHLEFLIDQKEESILIQELLNMFQLNSKVLSRDKGYMVYVKEAEKIGDFLRIISANNAVMYYEDIRIYRDHKNMTNRLNNCEQANIDKIIETATKQINDIQYLINNLGVELLDDKTKEALEYRLKYPDASLLELSQIITYETGKEITKSGLNHRFRKIRELVLKMNGD